MFGKVLKHGALAFSFASLLAACGGGGGDPSVPSSLPNANPAVTASLTFSVIDPGSGAATNTLNTAEGNTINVNLRNGTGAALSGQFVTVTSTVGTISPAGGQILTDASGNATARITSAGIDTGTAGVITATFNNTELGASDTETLNVQVGNTISSGGGAGGGTSGAVISLTATLFDQREYELDPTDAAAATTATVIDRINIVQPATLEVRLLLDGAPVDNAIVTTSTDLGLLDPNSGRIITNELGIATIKLSVGSAVSGEAGTISIAAAGATDSVTFGVGSATLKLGTGSGAGFTEGALNISDTTLSASGNTGVTVNVVDGNNNLFTTPVDVIFTSGCVTANDATIDSPVTTVGGTATASYSVTGCENSDTISASINGVAGPAANGTVSIIASIPNSIAFTGANPTNIALKSTGGNGRVENSDVSFQIIDNTGAPEAGVIVNFSLTTTTGGITLVDDTSQSNANGVVTAKVSSGNIPTPVRVIATISLDASGNSVADANRDGVDDNNAAVAVTETISTVSDVLVISTGLPDKNSFSLSIANRNPGGGNTDGVNTDVTVRAADKFNNPVPDGTAITFTTEFGSIQPSCTTTAGSCSVTWTSQAPRAHLTYTADDLDAVDCNTTDNGVTRGIPCRQDANFATPHGAFSRVVAFALGEETFVDANANGLFDAGEVFDDLPEVFLDHNDDGAFGNARTTGSCFVTSNSGCPLNEGGEEETFIDFDSDGVYDAADTIYNGSLCSTAAAAANACSTNLLNVSDDGIIVMSSTQPFFGLYLAGTTDTLISGTGTKDGVSLPAVTVDLRPDEFTDANGDGQFNAADGDVLTIDRNGNGAFDANGAIALEIDIADHFNGPLPNGTTVSITSTNCTIDTPTSFAFAEDDTGPLTIALTLTEDATTDKTSGVVSIAVSTVAQPFEFGCVDLN